MEDMKWRISCGQYEAVIKDESPSIVPCYFKMNLALENQIRGYHNNSVMHLSILEEHGSGTRRLCKASKQKVTLMAIWSRILASFRGKRLGLATRDPGLCGTGARLEVRTSMGICSLAKGGQSALPGSSSKDQMTGSLLTSRAYISH